MQTFYGPVDLRPRVGCEPERVADRAWRCSAKRNGQVEEDLARPTTDGVGDALKRTERRLLEPPLNLREVRRAHASTFGGRAERQPGVLATGAQRVPED